MSSYRDAWPSWTLVPEDVKARWWDFLKERCTWNPIRADTMKKIGNTRDQSVFLVCFAMQELRTKGQIGVERLLEMT
ncbi:unnamed protein product [Cuscuta campestris]|uniref:Uncharacterized protein n=1 Tax=Cuscuta campestris TaxID=132261 RepID=A0A484LF85_9ASTE|nr:unnamed protein product [Cuscuta campestris]